MELIEPGPCGGGRWIYKMCGWADSHPTPKTYYPWRFSGVRAFQTHPYLRPFLQWVDWSCIPKLFPWRFSEVGVVQTHPLNCIPTAPTSKWALAAGSFPWNQIFHLFQTGHSIRSWSLSIVELCWTFIPDCCVSWHDILMLITSHMTGSCIWVCFVVRFVVCLVSHQVKASPEGYRHGKLVCS